MQCIYYTHVQIGVDKIPQENEHHEAIFCHLRVKGGEDNVASNNQVKLPKLRQECLESVLGKS